MLGKNLPPSGGRGRQSKLNPVTVTAVIIVTGGGFVLLTVLADVINPIQVVQ